MLFSIIVLMLVLSAVCYQLTGVTLRHAFQNNMIDRPNERSSHCIPTPRGGGGAFAVPIIGILLLLLGVYPESSRIWIALAGGGAVVAATGWLDDRKGLSAGRRAAVHTVAAGWAVYWLGGFADMQIGVTSLHLGMFGSLLATLAIVWSINSFNFMDGIDGIAATQMIVVGAIAGALCWIGGHGALALAVWLIVAAVGGFLPWNWSPAKIFMGDCGSGLLGFLVGTLAVASENAGAIPVLTWCILMAVFLVDATATLIRRIGAGERWYEAHRSHAYQRAVQAGFPHARVVALVILINLLLGALAATTVFFPVLLLPTALISFSSLFWLWNRVRQLKPGRFDRTISAGDHATSLALKRAA